MTLPRREVPHRTASGLGGLVVGTPRPSRAGTAPAYFDPFALVPLGKTPLKVSRIALGTGTHGGGRQSDQTRMGEEEFDASVQFALTLGCVDVLDAGCQSPANVDDLAARVRRVERPAASGVGRRLAA
jgi:hypothetical protein